MKRLFDFLLSMVLILVLCPVMLTVALVVRMKMGSPVLFRQKRPGYKGLPFFVYKFRTMTDERGADGELLSDDQRLPMFGKFLRKTSVDELPQLFNVLKGDLSFVGPRPLLMEYLPLYNAEQARRHDVKPGITGWAQINGRNAISWNEKFKLDIWYVDNRSFSIDLKILWVTAMKIFKRAGVSAEGHVTMPRFMGNNEEQDE